MGFMLKWRELEIRIKTKPAAGSYSQTLREIELPQVTSVLVRLTTVLRLP
jgi:hypothetical protein